MASVDNFWVVVSFFGLIILFITLIVAWNLFAGVTELWDSSIGANIKADGQAAVNQFDFILVMAWLGLHLGVLAFAYFLRTHPIVYVIAIILVAVLAIVSAPISNAYSDLILEPDLSTAAASIPKTNYIMLNLPKFEVIWAIITAVVMFGLARTENYV